MGPLLGGNAAMVPCPSGPMLVGARGARATLSANTVGMRQTANPLSASSTGRQPLQAAPVAIATAAARPRYWASLQVPHGAAWREAFAVGAVGGALWRLRGGGRLRRGALARPPLEIWSALGMEKASGAGTSRSSSAAATRHAATSSAAVTTAAKKRQPKQGQPKQRQTFRYLYTSSAKVTEDDDQGSMPPMSADGGNQEEFEHYWEANAKPRCFAGGWVERCAHPQVNIEHYWFNEQTGQVAWQRPDGIEEIDPVGKEFEELAGQGPAWSMSVPDLKERLASGKAAEFGLTHEDLARRAVFQYEQFVPRVLSWHDFQHNTFWFFGGMKKKASPNKKGSFFSSSGNSGLFADEAFFREAAKLIKQRLGQMHPIPLTYFMWTFTRAGVILPDLMKAIGDHLCDGRVQMMDRCSLGTMVWNFGKQRVRHNKFFEVAATEFSRPNRVRSLAPRNFQNTFLAYGWNKHYNERLYTSLLTGMLRVMDEHDPPGPKLDRGLLFAYTCKDGSEVLADSLRITSLTVILRSVASMGISGPAMEACTVSMVDYMRRSAEKSPPMMRESGDCCKFLSELARLAKSQPDMDVASLLKDLDIPALCRDATEKDQHFLKQDFKAVGWPVEF